MRHSLYLDHVDVLQPHPGNVIIWHPASDTGDTLRRVDNQLRSGSTRRKAVFLYIPPQQTQSLFLEVKNDPPSAIRLQLRWSPHLPCATRLLVRYADDYVMLFENRRDGERVLAVLGKRLERFGLTLHADKTRFVDFRATLPSGRDAAETFDFLGFTHTWVCSQRGFPVLRQITAKDRFARAVRAVRDWCRRHRHAPLPEQHAYLSRGIRGHCAYYGRTGNSARLSSFRYQVIQLWRKWLSRRSRSTRINWDQMMALLRQYPLPSARAVHSKLAT